MTQAEAKEIEAQAKKLAKKIEIYTANNTTDFGQWKTDKARKQVERMEKELSKLDEMLENFEG